MNFGSIYRDFGKIDEVLIVIINVIECDEGNIEVLQNLKSFVSDIEVNVFNRDFVNKVYEKFFNCDDFFYCKIG